MAGERGIGGEDGGALVEMEMDVALEVDGEAEIGSGGKEDEAAAGSCSGFNGAIDGGRIEGFAVAGGAVLAHVEQGAGCGGGLSRCGEGEGSAGCAEAAGAEKVAAKVLKVVMGWILERSD